MCWQAVAQDLTWIPEAQRGSQEAAQQLRSNQSGHLPPALGSSRSTAPQWTLPYGSSRAKQAFPCFRTRPSFACSRSVPPESDVHSTEHRPWLEPAVAAKPSVSARIGAQTSWQLQLYTCIPNRTKGHVLGFGHKTYLRTQQVQPIAATICTSNMQGVDSLR